MSGTTWGLVQGTGIAFGYDEGIRLSYCTTLDVLNEGLTRFEQFCREH